mmetsp:Transcript_128979/g.373174  ORF Transcript_128979/g.373174 Transcript_128979/m.373174 type:complete len:216 (+) Transcript_128979:85-732(+)
MSATQEKERERLTPAVSVARWNHPNLRARCSGDSSFLKASSTQVFRANFRISSRPMMSSRLFFNVGSFAKTFCKPSLGQTMYREPDVAMTAALAGLPAMKPISPAKPPRSMFAVCARSNRTSALPSRIRTRSATSPFFTRACGSCACTISPRAISVLKSRTDIVDSKCSAKMSSSSELRRKYLSWKTRQAMPVLTKQNSKDPTNGILMGRNWNKW